MGMEKGGSDCAANEIENNCNMFRGSMECRWNRRKTAPDALQAADLTKKQTLHPKHATHQSQLSSINRYLHSSDMYWIEKTFKGLSNSPALSESWLKNLI